MSIQLSESELNTARKISYESVRRYRGYVEAVDVQQELAIWMLKHDEKVRGWREGTGYRALYTALKRVAHRYCEREKSAKVGYHPSDNVSYGVALIRGLLKDALEPNATHKRQNDGDVKRGAFESRPPLPVEVIDVRRGLKLISEKRVQVLVDYLDCGFDYQEMAELATTEDNAPTDEAMRRRVYDALRALADSLNAPREEWPHVNNPYAGIPRRSTANMIRQQNGESA